MTTYVFRVWLLANPPLGFDPDEEVWRDVAIDGSRTLHEFHEAIFEAFDRWDRHGYEFVTHDADGIATRRYVAPGFYEGGSSWPPMDDAAIERFVDEAVPADVSEDAIARFRELRTDPPDEADAAETTIDAVDPAQSGSMVYAFDFGDGWEHRIECRETRAEPVDEGWAVVDEQGRAPPQYPDGEE